MANSWSELRKELEQDFLCDKLRGRVQYFITHYHKAPDQFGRFSVRIDGEEVLMGNPIDFYRNYNQCEDELKKENNIPKRVFSGGKILNNEVNLEIEKKVEQLAINDGVFEIYFFTDAIKLYKSNSIHESLYSRNSLVRMFAILDRRIGKRTLEKLKSDVEKQPEWLQFFYDLRLNAENINKTPQMRRLVCLNKLLYIEKYVSFNGLIRYNVFAC